MEKPGIENRDRERQSSDGLESSRAAARMRRAVDAMTTGSGSRRELDAAARELVTELRRANEPPEQVLLHIKEILEEAGLRPSHGPADPALLIDGHAAVYREVIQSSIRHYFSDDGEVETS